VSVQCKLQVLALPCLRWSRQTDCIGPFESPLRASAPVPQLDHQFPPARGARRRGGMVELDFQAVVVVCLVVGRHVYPRCSRKKRTGESREKNADASVTEHRSRQQRRPSVHAVKHRSTLRTNTDVSVRSAEKCRETPQYFAYRQRCLCGPQRSVH
jgi:hypothetical protein